LAGNYTPNTTACVPCTGNTASVDSSGQCTPCLEGFFTADHISCLPCPINTTNNGTALSDGCDINCTLILGPENVSLISSGFGGPCFNPYDLGLKNVTIDIINVSSNPPIWAYVLVPILGVFLIILVIVVICMAGSGNSSYEDLDKNK
jgi:hypothetical protein